ncbi:phosphatidylethanolamine-binding protein (PEBP) family [Rhizoctonia solani]|uniref:Phosphatidylethanolamine-binding protein (PEBP) family n=1 Tax=Rhizoctonia solani TaxID=456999 RepID=A0A8H8T4G8_9AGAM|nr:phosphatidylethanolamine-binding protein (PEBP) family [Rhizoctonia solani]QRW27672.1 phosphatidylethanolamine-binding protein (PEBP) family [Rhizoctonia solani]
MRHTLFLALLFSSGLVTAVPTHKCKTKLKGPSRPTLDQVKESFYEAHIVPDLLPEFDPTSLLYLTYKSDSFKDKDSGIVLPGKRFAKDATSSPPEISFEGPGWPGPYVFFLLDPDAPSHSDPKWSQVRHMFAGNLTIDSDSERVPGSVVLGNSTEPVNYYMPPAPPGSGFHRYVGLLYAQPPDFDYSFLNTSDRFGFNITQFSKKSGLGTPLAGTFLTVKVKEDDDAYWLPMHMIKDIWSYWRQIAFKIL